MASFYYNSFIILITLKNSSSNYLMICSKKFIGKFLKNLSKLFFYSYSKSFSFLIDLALSQPSRRAFPRFVLSITYIFYIFLNNSIFISFLFEFTAHLLKWGSKGIDRPFVEWAEFFLNSLGQLGWTLNDFRCFWTLANEDGLTN